MGRAGKTQWDGLEAVSLAAGGYRALVVPDLGANVIRLQHGVGAARLDLLRTPDGACTLREDPYAYGMPVLCPANRIAGGGYEYDGVSYRFPQNYPNGVHIHGVLHQTSWQVAALGQTHQEAWATFRVDTREQPLSDYYPVELEFELECRLSAGGMRQRFTCRNLSEKTVPFGLAYHTALRVPFTKGGLAEDVRLSLPLAARCVDDPTDRLPSGKTAALTEYEQALASPQGADPLQGPMDFLYEAQPDTSDAVLRDLVTGREVVYRAGPDDHYWILWNKTATEGFIAVEPQTWLSNGIHLPEPERHGVLFLPPHSAWSGDTVLFVR